MERLEKKIGYTFHNRELLRTALTHSSFANESRDRRTQSNERLEFLGDSVLGMVTSDYIFKLYTDIPEGELTKLRASVVCEQALHEVAINIGLSKFILLGRGEEAGGGRERSSILADAVEAIIGAMYMDGGSETVNALQYDYIHYILGNIADFDSEELSFTEEELLAIVKEILAQPPQDKLDDNPDAWELNASRELAQSKINKPVTFLPLYAADGGVTAYISHFAAVNRNTKRPEDAFKVIEILMSKHFQRWSDMSSHMLSGRLSLPLHEDLFSPAEPIVGNNYFMTEENFEAFKAVRAQITGANFESEGTVMLSEMLNRCSHAADFGMTVEEIVHETYEMLERRLKE